MPQDVGVELPPREFGDEAAGPLAVGGGVRREVGEDRARVDLAVLQRRGQAARGVQIGAIALLSVVLEVILEKGSPPGEGRGLPRVSGRTANHATRRAASPAVTVDSGELTGGHRRPGDVPGPLSGRGPPVFAPRA